MLYHLHFALLSFLHCPSGYLHYLLTVQAAHAPVYLYSYMQ